MWLGKYRHKASKSQIRKLNNLMFRKFFLYSIRYSQVYNNPSKHWLFALKG